MDKEWVNARDQEPGKKLIKERSGSHFITDTKDERILINAMENMVV